MKLLKIALNAGALSKKKGIELGPDSVVGFLDGFYMNEAGMMPLFDVSDVKVDNSNIGASHEGIFEAVKKLNNFAILLGGDHSMTYPAFSAFARNNPGAGLIVFDAHPDCQEHNIPPTHEDYLRVLIDGGILDSERVIIVGARNMSKEERKYLDEKRIKSYSMKEISFEGVREVCDSIMSVARGWSKIYLSVDIDVLDAAFAPGTGYPEPGGLTSRELIYMVQRIKMLRNLGMADLVEVNPEKDVHEMTAKAAAKIIVELS